MKKLQVKGHKVRKNMSWEHKSCCANGLHKWCRERYRLVLSAMTCMENGDFEKRRVGMKRTASREVIKIPTAAKQPWESVPDKVLGVIRQR